MADPYEIPFTDEINKGTISVDPDSINTETSVDLIGRNLTDYGTSLNKNFLHLLENFADVTPPINPVEGQLWYDTTEGVDQLKIYDGTNWVSAGGLKKGTSQPALNNSVPGDLWVDTSNSQLYLYTGTNWTLVGPTYSDTTQTGTLTSTITDISNIQRTVIINYIGGVEVSIISDIEFKPKTSISGFPTIYKGITMRNFGTTNEAKIRGTSARTEAILRSGEEISGTRLPLLDVENNFSQKQIVNNDNGIEVGLPVKARLIAEGTGAVLQSNQPGGNVDLQVNNDGSIITAIRVKSDGSVGIGQNNLNPLATLDVDGGIIASGIVELGDGTDADPNSPAGTGSLQVTGGAVITEQTVIGTNLTVGNQITATTIEPTTGNTGRVGSLSKPYTHVYAQNFTAVGGSITGNVTGNVSGRAGSADKLTSPTTILMDGDVVAQGASGIVFDGQNGGLSTLEFQTSISDTFINTKLDIVTTLGRVIDTDELIIYRPTADDAAVDPSGTTGVFKTTKQDLVDSISVQTTPIGTVSMFAGPVAPDGWFFCDGSAKAISTYGALATALGYNGADPTTYYWGDPSDFGFSPSSYFCIPDYRGRMPVGLGLPGGSNRITDASAGTLGGVAGAEEVTLTVNNLPEHEHDFKDPSNNQYYATTTASGALTGGAYDSGTGSRIATSGGINGGTTNAPVNITNPFGAINFIIYHGVHS